MEKKKMKIEASDKNTPQKKPYIKKGFYHGMVVDIKPKKAESKFGKKLVILFEIIDSPDHTQLAHEIYSEYKQEDGTYRTALTPNSNATKLFIALGWTFSNSGIETNDFIGKDAEVLVEDYEYDFTDPITKKVERLKASTIKSVSKWQPDQQKLTYETL